GPRRPRWRECSSWARLLAEPARRTQGPGRWRVFTASGLAGSPGRAHGARVEGGDPVAAAGAGSAGHGRPGLARDLTRHDVVSLAARAGDRGSGRTAAGAAVALLVRVQRPAGRLAEELVLVRVLERAASRERAAPGRRGRRRGGARRGGGRLGAG